MKPSKFQILLGSGVLQIWHETRPYMREVPLSKVDTIKLMRHLNNSPEWYGQEIGNSVITFTRIMVEG